MEEAEILEKVIAVFRDELDDDDIVLTSDSTANDVEEWDSLTHIQLVVAIEKKFNLKFTSKEIISWGNVGSMINSISEKLNK